MNQNGAKGVRTIFNGSNDLIEKENALIIDATTECSMDTGKFKAPLLINSFNQNVCVLIIFKNYL